MCVKNCEERKKNNIGKDYFQNTKKRYLVTQTQKKKLY